MLAVGGYRAYKDLKRRVAERQGSDQDASVVVATLSSSFGSVRAVIVHESFVEPEGPAETRGIRLIDSQGLPVPDDEPSWQARGLCSFPVILDPGHKEDEALRAGRGLRLMPDPLLEGIFRVFPEDGDAEIGKCVDDEETQVLARLLAEEPPPTTLVMTEYLVNDHRNMAVGLVASAAWTWTFAEGA